nr:hypothetical protein [Sedimentibacter sp.]
MNLKNKRYIVVILVLIILASIFNVEYFYLNNNIVNHGENNFNKYYIAQEIINMIEDINDKQYNIVQSYKFVSRAISNSYDKYIARNIGNFSNVYKAKYSVALNGNYDLCDSCVDTVLYIHKKDGKKHNFC